MAGEQTRLLPFWHSMINKTLTLLSNMFSNLERHRHGDVLQGVPHGSAEEHSRSAPTVSGFEPEITMKCAKRKLRVYEVPISYHGRTYEEGKKIGWKDGVKALGVILYFWLVDDLYRSQLRPRHAEQPHRERRNI